jgi:hypothetical protein
MATNLICHYCSVELFPGDPTTAPTKDHVVPRAMGGLDIRWNIVIACRDCNSRKADQYRFMNHDCSFCRRTRRRHWEMFKIRGDQPRRKRQD